MASRDNQTMQIFIIVLALVSLCLSVGLFMVNNARKTAVAQAKNAKESENAARATASEKNNEATEYKAWLGYPEADTFQTLTQTYDEDMKRWGSTFENPSFRTILENIFEENRKLAQSEGDAKAQAKDLKLKLLEVEKQKNEQIEEFTAKANKAIQDKEGLRIQFDKDRDQSNQEKAQIAAQLAEKREEVDRLVAEHNATEQALEDKITKLDRVIEILKSKTAIPDPYAQPEDGRIAWVNQREGKVWINIGESDELRPQVTFSVYSGDTNDVNAGESKGSIEVIRLLGTGMAEARITDDKSTRPLMEGDKVYSQVWNRGRKVGFAITGFIDLNDDGTDDTEQLKRIIQLNNGVVDAVPTESGEIDGEMTVDTRYLILGKHPENQLGSSDAIRKAFQSMSEEADTLNIEVITLEEFLSLMGWRAEHRAVKVGKSARSEDFPPRADRDRDYRPRKLNSSESLFRQRKPQPRY